MHAFLDIRSLTNSLDTVARIHSYLLILPCHALVLWSTTLRLIVHERRVTGPG